MALKPNQQQTPEQKQAARDDVLVREIDEAVRQDQMTEAAQRYGVPVLIGLVVILAAFGGWLYYDHRREAAAEADSEQFVVALDQADRREWAASAKTLQPLEDEPGTSAPARLLAAGNAIEQGRTQDGVKLFDAVAADDSVPQPYRDLATIRSLSLTFDQTPPQQIVARLKPLAVPGSAWFGSAGELLAMAYLKQNRTDLAGPLFATMARDESVPDSLRSRARQLAGMLGVDAIGDPGAENGAEAGGGAIVRRATAAQ